jgi:hypothetical protein
MRAFEPAHPMQPIVLDEEGTPRFKINKIVRFMIDESRVGRTCDLDRITTYGFSVDDVEQFWQLLGYSVPSYGDLSFVRKETIRRADRIAEKLVTKRSPKRSPKRSRRRMRNAT